MSPPQMNFAAVGRALKHGFCQFLVTYEPHGSALYRVKFNIPRFEQENSWLSKRLGTVVQPWTRRRSGACVSSWTRLLHRPASDKELPKSLREAVEICWTPCMMLLIPRGKVLGWTVGKKLPKSEIRLKLSQLLKVTRLFISNSCNTTWHIYTDILAMSKFVCVTSPESIILDW